MDEWYEKQYTPSYWSKKHPNKDAATIEFLTNIATRSNEIQEGTPNDLNVSYGVSPRQSIDYFYADKSKCKFSNKPVFVFVHGGYWQEGTKGMYSLVTNAFTKHKFNTAVIGYDLAPTSSILQIITQISEAVDVIYSHFNKSQLIIVGHSSGAFLSAVATRARSSLVKNIVLISGIYDLCPLVRTSHNEALKLTLEHAQDLSSLVSEYNVGVPVNVYVGQNESSELIKQSEFLYNKLIRNEIPCVFKVVSDEDHFSMIEKLGDEDFVVCRDILCLGNFASKAVDMALQLTFFDQQYLPFF